MRGRVLSKQVNIVDEHQLQSLTIDMLRFPLLIMVIFIHMNPATINLIDADFSMLSKHGLYNVVCILFSHVISRIAVPCFYLISGLLFFWNFKKWTWGGYKNKMKSRIKSLVIPYLAWNILFFLLHCTAISISQSPAEAFQELSRCNWHILYDINVWGTDRVDWLGNHLMSSGPYDLPLWFLRDLIVVTLFAPVIYWGIKRLKLGFPLLLFLAYISRVWIQLPGFSITAFFYFTLGAYFAINGLNVVTFAKRYKYVILPVAVMLLIASVIYDGSYTAVGFNILPFFVIAGVFSAFYIVSIFVSDCGASPNAVLVSSCMFIYALHGVPIPGIWTVESFCYYNLQKVFGLSGFSDGVSYLLCPFVTAILCLGSIVVLRKVCPRAIAIVTGGR